MATTKTLQSTVNVTSVFCRQMPLTGVGGFTNEPAFTIGDWIRGFILAPPFAWRWNRATVSIPIANGNYDYTVALPDFGWLEKGSVSDGQGNTWALENKLVLGEETVVNRPAFISAQKDDDAGNITFRFMPQPDKNYTAIVTYQKAAPTFANLSDLWAPIPDYLSYLYTQGFLAKAYEYANDERFAVELQMFTRLVAMANGGLDETQLNIFLGQRVDTIRELQTKVSGRGER